MTLYRQIFIVIVALFVMMFVGTMLVNFHSTRLFLTEQLESHAQDTATSLGVSLSRHMQTDDLPAMDTMVNAVFDRGYYQEITIESIAQTQLTERVQDLRIQGVPRWFIRLVPLHTPRVQAAVMSGWKPVATVYVRSHPGFAYKELWHTSTRMFIWFSILAILAVALAAWLLRNILKPLGAVEQQAQAVHARNYDVQVQVPKTRELRSVVLAMNRMTAKVKSVFEEQSRTAEQLKGQAFRDSVTGIGNRRHLDMHLRDELRNGQGHQQGALLLIQLRGLRGVNDRGGLKMGDDLLRAAAKILNEQIQESEHAIFARIGGADFGLLLPGIDAREADTVAAKLCDRLTRLHMDRLLESPNCAHVGAAVYATGGRDPVTVLSEADTALRSAQAQGPNTWHRYQSDTDLKLTIRGRDEWKSLLIEAIQSRSLIFYVQPVVFAHDPDRVLHMEVLIRIPGPDGHILNAEVFMPMAAQLGLATELDQLVLTQVLTHFTGIAKVPAWAVNLSPASLRDDEFTNRILQTLSKEPAAAEKVTLECTEFGAVRELGRLQRFAPELRRLGSGFALDHFGRGFSPFGYLQSLQPDYVKIDAAYTSSIAEDRDNQFYVGALCNVAHSLDIMTIAEAVEGRLEWDVLRELSFDGIQGYAVGRPIPLEEWEKSI